MKKLSDSNIKFVAGIFMISIFMISNSCSKSTAYNTPTTGNTGSTGGTGGPGANQVFIQGMAFNPASITVTAGTTITWTNKDVIAHTVTSDSNVFDSGSVKSGGTFSFTFSTAGTYSYHCTIHPSMVASVIVN
jgi:plastocyanin